MLGRPWFSTSRDSGIDKNNEPFASSSARVHDDIKGQRHTLAASLSTPHDVLLASISGRQNEQLNHTGDATLHKSTSSPILEAASSPVSHGLDTVIDPFTGNVLGKLVPPDPNSTTEPMPSGDEFNKNEELWSHLSRVLDLQSEIAQLHMDMEGIGIKGDAKGKKNKGKSSPRLARKRDKGEEMQKMTSTTTLLDDPEHVGEDEGVDVGAEADEEERKNKEREEEFARLADQFEGRKESINDIMQKLDQLSQALAEFHALQAPQARFPSSRHNSIPLSVTSASGSPILNEESSHTTLTPIIASSTQGAQSPTSPPERVLSSHHLVESPTSTTGAFNHR
ncbi:hypothetical protein Moror_16411 [Moniliophthora roreri MCA 2997]|uniref:Uncharacterized protein n=1 Tax=Moniliophthora roreri (strain MCA 2997) TaxID=1381753 RepID=V2XEH0_MONRO|nr:hypothetical protein Moror_16411 [Moniliophthora roreri MCA 2997]